MRLKDVAILNPNYIGADLGDELVSFSPMECLRFDNLRPYTIPFKNAKGKYTYFANNDVLFAKVTPCFENLNTAVAANLLNGIGFGSSEINVLRFSEDCYARYFFYLVCSRSFIDNGCASMCGVGGLKRVNPLAVTTFEFELPSRLEQEAIAAYLDKECGKIGKMIGLLERKADCYRNLRHSLIIKTVTQKKPNYRAYRLKDIFELRNGYTPSKAVSEFWEGGTIPWFRMEDIRKNGRILSDSIQHITQEAIKTAGLFEANSFILSTTATIGEHALLIADSLANQQFTNLKIHKSLKDKVSVKWMFYKFFHIDEYCKRGCRITTFAAVDMVELTNMPIYLPPIEEQLNNVAYLDDKCNKIDVIINNIESKIELLKELKRSLINEVVTGQRAINISKS